MGAGLERACREARNKNIEEYKRRTVMNVNLEILKLNHAFKWSDLIGKQLKIQEMTSDEGVQVIFALSECGRVYIIEINENDNSR